MTKYRSGPDYLHQPSDHYLIYGISTDDHANKIVIYGDLKLRDRILAFLEDGGRTFWIIIYHHEHGEDAWPVFADSEPNLEAEAAKLDTWEPDREEWLASYGPFTSPS